MATALRGRAALAPLPAYTISKSCKIYAENESFETRSKNWVFFAKVRQGARRDAANRGVFDTSVLSTCVAEARLMMRREPCDWSGTSHFCTVSVLNLLRAMTMRRSN